MNTSPQGECSNPFQRVNVNANVNAQKNMVDRYSCINLLYSFALSDP